MLKRFIIAILILIIVFGGIAGYDTMRVKGMAAHFANNRPPPATISAVKAVSKAWSPELMAVGTVQAVNGATLSVETSGRVEKILFQSGQMVKKGDLLLSLDDGGEQAALDRDSAAAKYASATYLRDQILSKQKLLANADLDQAKSSYDQALATVQIDMHNLREKHVLAPFDGRLGIRQVSVGQYVTVGTPVVSLESIDPVYVNFSLPQENLAAIKKGLDVVAAFGGKNYKGKITAINAVVEKSTRSIQVQATFLNSDGKLYPGAFVKLHVVLPVVKKVILVPHTAVTYSTYGDTVFVVQKGKQSGQVVKLTPVKIGPSVGDKVIIKQGIQAGDQVVDAGQMKLHDGSAVQVNNTVKLS